MLDKDAPSEDIVDTHRSTATHTVHTKLAICIRGRREAGTHHQSERDVVIQHVFTVDGHCRRKIVLVEGRHALQQVLLRHAKGEFCWLGWQWFACHSGAGVVWLILNMVLACRSVCGLRSFRVCSLALHAYQYVAHQWHLHRGTKRRPCLCVSTCSLTFGQRSTEGTRTRRGRTC